MPILPKDLGEETTQNHFYFLPFFLSWPRWSSEEALSKQTVKKLGAASANLESVLNIEEADIRVDSLLIAPPTVRPFIPHLELKVIERTSSSLSSDRASIPSPSSLASGCKTSASLRVSPPTRNHPISCLYPSGSPSLPAKTEDGESSDLASHYTLWSHQGADSVASLKQTLPNQVRESRLTLDENQVPFAEEANQLLLMQR